jgi:hypothetical protein
MVREIDIGGMQPIQYWMPHPNSRLSDAQKQWLIDEPKAMFGA